MSNSEWPTFVVYLPDVDSGIRMVALDPDRYVSSLIAFLIESQIYGDSLKWEYSPNLVKARDLRWDPPETIRDHIKSWWTTKRSPERMDDGTLLKTYFPQAPAGKSTETIDIVLTTTNTFAALYQVRRPISLSGVHDSPTIQSLTHPSLSAVSPRDHLVSYLYDMVTEEKFFMVHGTPGSGKTTLCSLLYNYILAKEVDTAVSLIGPWSQQDRISESLQASLVRGNHIDLEGRRRHWLLFDDAQTTYEDHRLWNTLLKGEYHHFLLVLFAPYVKVNTLGAHIIGTPNNIQAHQCIGLRPTENGLYFRRHIPGLHFLRDEYDTFLHDQSQKTDVPTLGPDLADWVYEASMGHPGAIASVLKTINSVAHKIECPNEMSLDTFLSNFDSPEVALKECTHGDAFESGLPKENALVASENMAAVDFLQHLIRPGIEIYRTLPPEGAKQAHRLGWISIDTVGRFCFAERVEFPSCLHRSRLSYLLNGSKPLSLEVGALDLRRFIVQVLGAFSASALRQSPTTSSQAEGLPSIPENENKWQNEAYRGVYTVTGGHGMWLSPHLTSPGSGRVDIHIQGNKKWGIAVLREGDRIENHLQRFEPGGAYHTWIQKGAVEEYVVLNFEESPTAQKKLLHHPTIYHVSFDEGFNRFHLKDWELQELESGTLLA
ncbi:hypothetical protein B0H11DRAFT_2213327 [Mycena galericulata]|nr:hypothetical protein B0H11DRAFT_2213327 [Mycena galericulata]